MALDYRREKNSASRLGDAADELQTIKSRLNNILSTVQVAYKANERVYFDQAVNNIQNKISTLNRSLNNLENNIGNVAYDIYCEDKVREARLADSLGHGGGFPKGGSGFGGGGGGF